MTRSTLATARSTALTPPFLELMREMLQQQRAFRVDQLVQLRRPGQPGPLGCADDEIARSLAAGARAALHEVQKALWRLEEGCYGRCTRCDRVIDPQRLEILPQIALCLPCQRGASV